MAQASSHRTIPAISSPLQIRCPATYGWVKNSTSPGTQTGYSSQRPVKPPKITHLEKGHWEGVVASPRHIHSDAVQQEGLPLDGGAGPAGSPVLSLLGPPEPLGPAMWSVTETSELGIGEPVPSGRLVLSAGDSSRCEPCDAVSRRGVTWRWGRLGTAVRAAPGTVRALLE